jgi:hypothetical protein
MKNRFYALMLFGAVLMFSQHAHAQGVRYHDMIFDSVSITTVTYSDTFSQQMDVYQPVGDSVCNRPVIVFAHGGSFISGDRTDDNAIITWCTNFARRGFVTASIDYRLGNEVNMVLDSTYAITEVMQAIGDGKAAIRYFRKDAYTANQFKIDTNYIFAGGNSAGAVLYMHVIYIDTISLLPGYLATVVNANGGIEGNSGNAGYSSRINAVLSGAGGLNQLTFIHEGSKPSINFQGSADQVVPYVCADAEQGAIAVRLCGLGSLEPLYEQFGVTHVSVVYPGDGHVPWQDSSYLMTQLDTMSADFLDTLNGGLPAITVCPTTGIKEVTLDDAISVFPNPAIDQVKISMPGFEGYSQIQLIDGLGRVITTKPVSAELMTINRGNFSAGVYMVKILHKADNSFVVRKVVFE